MKRFNLPSFTLTVEPIEETLTTLYRVGAYHEYDGRRFSGDLPKLLGDAYGRYYATKTEAQEVADDLQDSVDECGPKSTTYTVEPVSVSVSDVSAFLASPATTA